MDKFYLNRDQMLDLAKKNIVNNIYNSAKLEGIRVTHAQIKEIIENVNDSDIDKDDLQIILNLYNAWNFVLDNLDEEMSLHFACSINNLVSFKESLDWGVLRYGDVGINGVDYKPVIPVKEIVLHEINEILSMDESITHRAILYMLYGMRSQLFWDGNKRTSTLCANKLLIQHGKGLITIPEIELQKFHTLLSEFYETNDHSKIYRFIYDICLCR